MYPSIFNSIVFDENMDLCSCLKNEYICAAMAPHEIGVIVHYIGRLYACGTFEEFSDAVGWPLDALCYEFHIDEKCLQSWKEEFQLCAKYFLMFIFFSMEMETLRYHTCQMCGDDYFSKEAEYDVCDKCAAEIYRRYMG